MGKEQVENSGVSGRARKIIGALAIVAPGVVVGGAAETLFGYRPADLNTIWITIMTVASVISVGTGVVLAKGIGKPSNPVE